MNCITPAPAMRPPWPDELPRLAEAFPGLKWTGPMHLRVLLVAATANSPERLVGVAALAEPAAGETEAKLFLRLRARFADTTAADALLAEVMVIARGLGVPAIMTGQPASPDPREPALRRIGFTGTVDGKSWHARLG